MRTDVSLVATIEEFEYIRYANIHMIGCSDRSCHSFTNLNTPMNPRSYFSGNTYCGWMGLVLVLTMLLAAKPAVTGSPLDARANWGTDARADWGTALSDNSAQNDMQQTMRLFILAGQSNMVGSTGDAAGYPDDPHGIDPSIPFYWVDPGAGNSQGQWTHLQPQPGRFEAGYFGPEVVLARRLAEHYSSLDQSIAIFKYAQGGTSLAHDWKGPGEDGLYDRMVKELQQAVGLLENNGYKVVYEGFFWVQGESDARDDDMAAAYQYRLQRLVDDLKLLVLRAPELPVVLGVDEQHPLVQQRPEIVHAQQRLARHDAHVVFTSMIGLEKADQTHLTPAGLIGHGQRLFEGFLQLKQ